MSSRLLRAYIDETGDRGHSVRSSPFFAFAAVMVADEDEAGLRAVVAQLRRDLGVPEGKALHWKDHVKTYSRRQHVARRLSQAPGVMVAYVLVEKATLPSTSGMYHDHVLFYNFAAVMIIERILLAARDWAGGMREAIVRFGHVRGFDHSTTKAYFQLKAQTDPWIPWDRLHGAVHVDNQAQYDGLQAADQYAGMLNAALRADQFGGHEEAHLMRIQHQIRKNSSGRAWGRGFKVLGDPTTITSLPWWPAEGL
jgi:hypothetical protein